MRRKGWRMSENAQDITKTVSVSVAYYLAVIGVVWTVIRIFAIFIG